MTISAGQFETHTIPPGKVLKVVTDAQGTGQWRKLPNSGAFALGLLPIPASKTMNIGPYSIVQSVRLEALTGTLTTSIIDAHAEGSGEVYIDRSLTIDANNAPMFNGKTLIFTAAFTITLATGLPPGFGYAGIPPASGNASIASDGTVTINGATATVDKAAADVAFAVVKAGTDAFICK